MQHQRKFLHGPAFCSHFVPDFKCLVLCVVDRTKQVSYITQNRFGEKNIEKRMQDLFFFFLLDNTVLKQLLVRHYDSPL